MQSLVTVSVIVLKLLGEVKVFHADADTDTGDTPIAFRTFVPAS